MKTAIDLFKQSHTSSDRVQCALQGLNEDQRYYRDLIARSIGSTHRLICRFFFNNRDI